MYGQTHNISGAKNPTHLSLQFLLYPPFLFETTLVGVVCTFLWSILKSFKKKNILQTLIDFLKNKYTQMEL